MIAETEVKERPILFNAEMVRAVLDGRKTQTRRTKGLKGINRYPGLWSFWMERDGNFIFKPDDGFQTEYIKCPFGVPGDRLWVRETFRGEAGSFTDESKPYPFVYYRADVNPERENCHTTWKPSIFMPRAASRLLLEVTNVRVERVQDISVEDIEAEGIEVDYDLANWASKYTARFLLLWNSINEKKGFGWDVNPWVWVVEFKVVLCK